MAGNAPLREPIVDPETGKLNPIWEKYFTLTLQPLINQIIAISGGSIDFSSIIFGGGETRALISGLESLIYQVGAGGNDALMKRINDLETSGYTGLEPQQHYTGRRIPASSVDYTAGENVEEILDESLNSGLLHDCTLVDTGGLNITWPASEIWDTISDQEVGTNAGGDACTDDDVNYLIWPGAGANLTLGVVPPDPAANEIAIAHIICQTGDIWAIHQADQISTREYEISNALRAMFPSVIVGATSLIVSENAGGVPFDVAVSTGVYYDNGHHRHSVTGFNTTVGANLVRWFHAGGIWANDSNAEIDETQYDNGANLVAVVAARYYVSLFFMVDSTLHWVYPTAGYTTLAQAIAAKLPAKPPGLLDMPSLMTVVLKGNDAAFPLAGGERWLDQRNFASYPVGGGVGLGPHNILDGSVHQDSEADGVTRGSIIVGNATSLWDELVLGLIDTFLGSDGTDLLYRTAAQVLASLSGDAGAAFNWNNQNLSSVGTIDLVGGQIAFPAGVVPSGNPNTLDEYVELLTASTACTGAITTALAYTVIKTGRVVTLSVPSAFGVGVATNVINFGVVLPTKYRPMTNQYSLSVRMRDNGANQEASGVVQVLTTGQINIFLSGITPNFTVTAQAGFFDFCVSWITAA